MTQPANAPTGWWMHHGDPEHSGYVSDSPINSSNASQLKVFKELQLGGPVLSTPAVTDGFVYVGTANAHDAVDSNGGSLYKIELATGAIAATYNWDIPSEERDSHGFCGMGCTPAVIGGKVYFVAFNAKLYCLDQQTLKEIWVTDLRYADKDHNQPVTNTAGMSSGYPPVAGWSSPVVVNNRVYTGIGEGENPSAYTFVYCLDADTGKVIWLYCTNQFVDGIDNEPNMIPEPAVGATLPGFTSVAPPPITLGCSVWGGIAYDSGLDRLYCPTGNPSPDGMLPCIGYSNGLLALDASTGAFVGFVQFPPESSYRPTDIDVDVGGSPTLFTNGQGRRLVALGCKNGGFMILDAKTLEIVTWRQILPDASPTPPNNQFPAVDPHPPAWQQNQMNPQVTNQTSNNLNNTGENWTGTYSTAAVHPGLGRLFLGIGGKNYGMASPGIDTDTTPFLRAMDWGTLKDAWPMDNGTPPRYVNGRPPFYANATESGLALAAVVNDVVLMSTTNISVYAFSAKDGTLLWQDQLGSETGGFNGGYGYCMGPAVWKEYVVAGALVYGRDGGILRIYKLQG
ncbi:MAG TPA: PQQ-binding-like beta-propeller repeat protein [Thermoanaerobaculia bacterium]|jgi:outer membrane protein assembly factor BamB|nr:PQQ-binding-like beta-propeller repeat protein [Thermoanaerobaculia bacterium]